MCTITVIPLTTVGDDGFRLVTSRDESALRPDSLPPTIRDARGVACCWPVDPPSGGAWVGVNERGLCLAILNLNPVTPPPMPAPEFLRSRGGIIPALLHCAAPADAVGALAGLDLHRYAPFRLLAVSAGETRLATWDRDDLRAQSRPLEPMCLASCGLGDHLVEPRLALFSTWLAEADMTPERQDAFHAHQWPLRPEISVRMRREGAYTRSITVVDVRRPDEPACRMTYTDPASTSEVALRAAPAAVTGGARN